MLERFKHKYIFLSYSSREREKADFCRTALANLCVDVWMAPKSIPVGSNYMESIPDAICKSAAFLLLISKNSQKSKWVKKELGMAIDAGIPIFPICIEKCELDPAFKFALHDVQIIDWDDGIDDALCEIAQTAGIRNRHRGFISDCDRYGGYSTISESVEKADAQPRLIISDLPETFDTGIRSEIMSGGTPLSISDIRVSPKFQIHNTKTIPQNPRVGIIGVGGAGGNIVDCIREYSDGITTYAVDTDIKSLNLLKVENRIPIGEEAVFKFYADEDLHRGRAVALYSARELSEAFSDLDIVIIIAALGGSTGTGASPIIAKIARSMDKLVIAFVFKPLRIEGIERAENAERGVTALYDNVHSLVVMDNDKLKDPNDDVALAHTYEKMNAIIRNSIDAVLSTIRSDIDRAQLYSILCGGRMIVGCGKAAGENRDVKALRNAVHRCYGDKTIEGAKKVILNVSGNQVGTGEVSQIFDLVKNICAFNANIICNVVHDEKIKDEIQVTFIASDLE